jgi:hypothetical protein
VPAAEMHSKSMWRRKRHVLFSNCPSYSGVIRLCGDYDKNI